MSLYCDVNNDVVNDLQVMIIVTEFGPRCKQAMNIHMNDLE